MSAFQYQLPSIDRVSWHLPRPRLEPLVVALGLILPVPAFAATGMSIPMPSVVERLAAALVPWTEVAVLSDETKELAVRGAIVQTEAERATTAHSTAVLRQQAPVSVTKRTTPVERPQAVRKPVGPSVAPGARSDRGDSRPAGARPRSRTTPVAAVGPVVREPHKNPVTAEPAQPAKPEGEPKADKPPRTPSAPTAPVASPVGTRTPEPTAPTPTHTPPGDTVTQTVDDTVEPVVTAVEPVEETVKEKVDHVVVTVDKTTEKVVGAGEKVTHDVNVILQKLPKVLGG